MDTDSKLYEKLLHTIIELRDVQARFKTYSARDIKALIASKMKSVREPVDLRHLYNLEAMIGELRQGLTEAKTEHKVVMVTDADSN
jgi:hypothetical protein